MDPLKLRDHYNVWLGPNSCKCTLLLKLVYLISFNQVVRLRLIKYCFDRQNYNFFLSFDMP